MVKNDFQDIIKNILIFEWNYEKNLVVRIWWIKSIHFFIKNWYLNSFVFKKLLFCDIIESVEDMGACMLQSLPVIDLVIKLLDVLCDLSFSKFNLLLPSLNRVELFVIFAEIKTPIVQTLYVIFVWYFFTQLVKLLLAFVKFLHLLV